MRYSVANDKRNSVECVLYLIACVLCVALELFVLSKITFENPFINVLWVMLQCALTISPVFIVWVIKKIFSTLLLKICGIKNLTGIYNVEIQSNYKKGTISHAKIEIQHSFDEIKIYFFADNSKSCAINARLDNSGIHNVLYYSYTNEGNGVDKNNKMHIGTAVLTFINNNIDGYYYNNGKDRQTYGTIKTINKE